MRKKEIAIVAVVSYNFKTKETITKEFVESGKDSNPINEAEEYQYQKLNLQYAEEDGWQHKVFANKKAEQLRRKVWSNLDR
jgi:hypothetical protein